MPHLRIGWYILKSFDEASIEDQSGLQYIGKVAASCRPAEPKISFHVWRSRITKWQKDVEILNGWNTEGARTLELQVHTIMTQTIKIIHLFKSDGRPCLRPRSPYGLQTVLWDAIADHTVKVQSTQSALFIVTRVKPYCHINTRTLVLKPQVRIQSQRHATLKHVMLRMHRVPYFISGQIMVVLHTI
jgi:hypothetical protein